MRAQGGFSLIELSIALAIGAMVVLMTAMLYGSGIKAMNAAENTAMMIDTQSAVVNDIAVSMQRAGLGLNDLSGTQALILSPAQVLPASIADDMVTRTMPAATQAVHQADQLTIRYIAPMDLWDCEGEMALGPRRVRLSDGKMADVDGQVVIERYFIGSDGDGKMALRCDATHYITDEIARDGTRDRRGLGAAFTNAIIDREVSSRDGASRSYQIKSFHENGAVLLSDVEGLWVRLLVQDRDMLRLMPIDAYEALTQPLPIIGVKLAVLARAPFADEQPASDTINIMGQELTFDDGVMRRVFISDVRFDNVADLSIRQVGAP